MTTQAERDWHRTRRMLVLIDGFWFVAPPDDERGHREWFADSHVEHAYETCVRGFIDETGVYLYKGSDYRLDDDVRGACEHDVAGLWIIAKYDRYGLSLLLRSGMPVYGGMVPGKLGERWDAIEKIAEVP